MLNSCSSIETLTVQDVVYMVFGSLIFIPCFVFKLDCLKCRAIQSFGLGLELSVLTGINLSIKFNSLV